MVVLNSVNYSKDFAKQRYNTPYAMHRECIVCNVVIPNAAASSSIRVFCIQIRITRFRVCYIFPSENLRL